LGAGVPDDGSCTLLNQEELLMIVLNADDVRKALPMRQAVDAVNNAFAALSDGRAEVPIRMQLPVHAHEAVSLVMPAFVEFKNEQALSVKVVSVYPNNPVRGLPLIHAAVLVLEADSGRPLALLEGGTLTAIRTGAASGAASDLLARKDSQTLTIFGAGTQGATQLEAVCSIRQINKIWIYDPDVRKRQTFTEQMVERPGLPKTIISADNPTQAVQEADIICTATTSKTPVFNHSDIKSGVHINGIGSYTAEMREIPVETVKRALVVVDERSAALTEAGDIIQPLENGELTAEHIHAELGEIILGIKTGRTTPQQITFFKSVGNAVQDAACARLALKNAQLLGLGQKVNW
jgi:ornithine cyclodeaminase